MERIPKDTEVEIRVVDGAQDGCSNPIITRGLEETRSSISRTGVISGVGENLDIRVGRSFYLVRSSNGLGMMIFHGYVDPPTDVSGRPFGVTAFSPAGEAVTLSEIER